MILFLDFDGVLHPFPLTENDEHFSSAEHLWELLAQLPGVSIVITSTWRERYSLEELRLFLRGKGGKDLLQRIIGVTPVLENDSNYEPGIRQREIEMWLENNSPGNSQYLILDDIEEYFDRDCRNLYLVDGSTGLTDRDVFQVAQLFRSMDPYLSQNS